MVVPIWDLQKSLNKLIRQTFNVKNNIYHSHKQLQQLQQNSFESFSSDNKDYERISPVHKHNVCKL